MLTRCHNPNSSSFSYYGERGITIDESWLSFEQFYADMGDAPPNETLERIDNDGPYSPENCKWATRLEQARNARSNRLLTFQGETHCVTEWAEMLDVKAATLAMRLHRGWSVERTLTEPIHSNL